MPRIDPLQLLNCLNVLLTPSGGIKSEQEVARISSLMEKFSKKLVSKCVYLLILKSSDIHLLSKFMGLGGWNLIYNWLLHAVEAKNYPFLIELLEVIIICPVDIERLKSNPMPRQIKYLSKDSSVHPRVRDLASDIVKLWLAIVKGTPTVPVPVNNVDATEVEVTVGDNKTDGMDNHVSKPSASSEESGEDEAGDGNYVKSASPSSSSVDSEETDEYVPNKKLSKKTTKVIIKKEKPKKNTNADEGPKLKSKLVTTTDTKEPKRVSIKLKIGKKKDDIADVKSRKDTSTMEERLRVKRKLKEDKEKEKFAKLKQMRDKKDKLKDKRDDIIKDKLRDDKAKSDLSKLIPKSIDKLGRIPKKSPKESDDHQSDDKIKNDASKLKTDDKKLVKKDEKSFSSKPKENDTKKEKDVKKTLPIPPKKPVSMSVEKRFAAEEKPKTVKAYNSKFRLTGLEQEIIPKPPARKSTSSSTVASVSSVANSAGTSPPNIPAEKSAIKRSPTKDVEIEPAEKKLKSPDVSISEEKPSPVSTKTKKPFLQESDFFMNAMNIAIETQKESLRKRKKSSTQKSDADSKSDENVPRKNVDGASSPTVKSEKDVKPAFKFYTVDAASEENIPENVQEPDVKIPPEELIPVEDVKHVKIKNEPNLSKSTEGLKSALSIFRAKKLPKKTVKWKRDDELEAIQYFEVDASERTNVVRTFWDMQMMERTKERESMLMVRKITENDKMVVQTKWKPLIPIDVPPSSIVRGCNSEEKNIQYARERAVPPAIYFNKSMIPDTPAEPDPEIYDVKPPQNIPLDDISGSQDSISDFSSLKWPEPKMFPPDGAEIGMMAPAFLTGAGMTPPIFPFPDGSFPPFAPPFFPGAPVGPVPPIPPANWTPPNNDQTQQNQTTVPMNWPPPVPPVGPPGMIGPPPFGMMGPPFPPIPGPGFPAAPNLFPPPNMNQQQPQISNNGSSNNSSSTDNQQYSSSNNNYSSNSERSGKWNKEDRYGSRRDGWKNNYSDRNRDKRGSSNWRNSSNNPRMCRKKGYCNTSGCRFYHPQDD